MKLSIFAVIFVVTVSLVAANPVLAISVNCHLHEPNDNNDSEKESLIISSVGKPQECEQLNQERFYGKGRCHCSFGNIRQRNYYDPEVNPNELRNFW